MGNFKIFIFLAPILLISLSCRKNYNKISGNIFYTNKSEINAAAGATVYLYIPGEESYRYKTICDSTGNYDFFPIDDGAYDLYADLTNPLGFYYEELKRIYVQENSTNAYDLLLK